MTPDAKKRHHAGVTPMDDKNRILIIEDEPDVLIYFEALFQDNGYDTISAADGETGFALAQSSAPDLITLDITMPGQSGMSTYCRFRTDPDLIDIPIVIITATVDSMENFHNQMKDFPAPDGFVTKPVDTKTLLKKISTIFRDHHKR